ncbi:S1 family peptidase [Rhizobium ruizarguesonis]|uniref:S1 family peptidase n=1 Tax=Rhizobium ruizarguesonis TaxID=2081791 RepID=UPI0013D29C17|nr:serine protease [Rhizobium ruizarguesonis]NEH81840.1 trypsin-like serine protease [Rhizobium ruizarguesonis]NEI79456.1 trypsin-like serine protease [Rhizobium ruizarguesonis]
MRSRIFLITILCLFAVLTWQPDAWAGLPEGAIVYIECATPAGTSRGSGVLVNHEGFVLTARHVLGGKPNEQIPETTKCKGSIGVADENATRAMIVQPITVSVDAALLQFSDTREYEFMPVCKLENWMIRRNIFVAGFPGKTESGAPSFREGVLSTVRRNSKGVLETDGQTIAGMSGGPVFSNNLKGLVGIVLGAQFTQEGTVSYFGILPIEQQYIDAFSLTPSEEPCFHHELTTEFGPFDGNNAINLHVKVTDAACFLSSVGGLFNNEGDLVEVKPVNGEYWLTGANKQGGSIRVSARCIWYD